MAERFRVGVSPDFRVETPGLLEPALEEVFGPHPAVACEVFEYHGGVVAPGDIEACDAVLTLRARFTAESVRGCSRLAVVARWGVGYDMIDAPSLTEADVALAITPDAVRRPVAEAILTLMLALAKKLPAKDRMVREGDWSRKAELSGLGLRGKTFGSVGLGNIATDMFRLLAVFEPGRLLACDPVVPPEAAAHAGVELLDLDTVFRESDFLAVNCPLNDTTRRMIDGRLFSLMKPSAYFINTARGAIVDQAALCAALDGGQIAGAGLDVFEDEPLSPDDPLVRRDDVILSPHALAWTDDLYYSNGRDACSSILAVLQGRAPSHVANPEVLDRPGFRRKLEALGARWKASRETN